MHCQQSEAVENQINILKIPVDFANLPVSAKDADHKPGSLIKIVKISQ